MPPCLKVAEKYDAF